MAPGRCWKINDRKQQVTPATRLNCCPYERNSSFKCTCSLLPPPPKSNDNNRVQQSRASTSTGREINCRRSKVDAPVCSRSICSIDDDDKLDGSVRLAVAPSCSSLCTRRRALVRQRPGFWSRHSAASRVGGFAFRKVPLSIDAIEQMHRRRRRQSQSVVHCATLHRLQSISALSGESLFEAN